MFRCLFALIRRPHVLAVCLLLGAAFGITRKRDRLTLLAKTLRELTPEQQRVIYLRFIAGLDTSEIARIMGNRRDDVGMLQLHALRSLLRVLAKFLS